ncbi:LysR family transcriptional regulator [Thalassomonas actiniarum]|uniref:LysR family transcriptional regulator n=1 Tax=Thalassomonas actiniarum TaxID=485447 RepID=A0AAE9YV38_9GAMM|nr:LysR family transcriptional regulator [Thalassomonas actiniarum]WDE01132.1 LysR family transcriptional regulator [Thalassomonas actiniarum]
MTLEQLQTLNSIVQHGSLKAAAGALHKTQPALSMAIKKLEAEYGFEILDRSGYRLGLTPPGKAFYQKAQELLLNAEQLHSLGQHLASGNEALVRLAYDSVCPHDLIFTVLKKCQRDYPQTELHVFGESRFGALELLQKAEIDLAISPWWPTFHSVGDFEALKIGHFEILLVAAPGLFNGQAVTNVAQLKSEVYLVSEESELSFDSENLMLIKGARKWKTRDMQTLKQMLLSGLGWGYIPRHLAEEALKDGRLVSLTPQGFEFSIQGEICLVRREEHTLGPVAAVIWKNFLSPQVS